MKDDCLNPKSIIGLAPNPIIDAGGYHLLTSRIFFVLGIIFAVLGIIGDAINSNIGLQPLSWFLLSIGVVVAGIPPCLGWAVAVYLKSMKGKKD